MDDITIFLGSLSLFMLCLNLFQLWFIPRRTRKRIEVILNGNDNGFNRIQDKLLKAITNEITGILSGDKINKEIADKVFKSSMGKKSGHARQKKKMEQALLNDIINQNQIGQFLNLFPEFRTYVENNPQAVKTFMTEYLPLAQQFLPQLSLTEKVPQNINMPDDNIKN